MIDSRPLDQDWTDKIRLGKSGLRVLYLKTRGLFSKTDARRGIGCPEPSISRWTVETEAQGRESTAGQKGRPTQWSSMNGGEHLTSEAQIRAYGPRFGSEKARGARGAYSELVGGLGRAAKA